MNIESADCDQKLSSIDETINAVASNYSLNMVGRKKSLQEVLI